MPLTLKLLIPILFSCTCTSLADTRMEELGQQLYFDTNLSNNRTQSCATCHDPSNGFIDVNTGAKNNWASFGDNGESLGDRNTPTSAYANQIPPFHVDNNGNYKGGQFWDGRASTLKDQAAGPPLNADEMGMVNKISVSKRLQENPAYLNSFKGLFGEAIFESPDDVYESMTQAIASFEKTTFFSPFDSKYDRYLIGEYIPTKQEELGMTLFFSEQFTNCNQCHQLKKRPMASHETFSDYSYHNIGVPSNKELRKVNGKSDSFIDEGLLGNPSVTDEEQRGKFKVPTLRNIAVTSPYMHNGIFQELRTVVVFYNKYNSKHRDSQINPESGQSWEAPEVPLNISFKELEHGPALDDKRIDALVAFLNMLTDRRFEH